MTKTVKGAGRKRYTQQKKKHDQRDVVVGGGEHTKVLKDAAKSKPKKKAAPKPKSKTAGDEPDWVASEPLGANVARMREASVTWRRISEIATENGHDVPWPDGGKLVREMKRHLNGGASPTPSTRSKVKATPEEAQMSMAKRLADREVPWDGESTDEDMLAFLEGHTITFINGMTGTTESLRVPEGGKHTKLDHGENGPYITFASNEGPFRSISLSKITKVS
jgi:hypothetical protein